jgi:hypothetical protein
LEYRKLNAFNKSDAASQIQGEVLGTGAPTPDRSGTFTLKEAYTEAIVPIISDKPFAHSVSLELGYRRSKFEALNSDSYGSYKYGGEWAPLQELRFRVMQQRATRSTNINELFAPTVTGLSNLSTDPCQGSRINASSEYGRHAFESLPPHRCAPVVGRWHPGAFERSNQQPNRRQYGARTGEGRQTSERFTKRAGPRPHSCRSSRTSLRTTTSI